MFVTRKRIPRRTLLRGLGVSLALPLLDSMFPACSAAAPPKTPRFVGIFSPHGWSPGYWDFAASGPTTELPFILKPLDPFLDSVSVISGLDATSSFPPPGTAGGDHSRSAAVLSGVPPKKTVSEDIYLGTTIDQMIAQKYGQDTALPSIQLGIEDQSALATCPWGYSCAYVNSISWAGPTRPLPHEANPQVVFERLFGDGSTPQERIARKQAQASLLDAVTQEVARLNKTLPGTDRTRLNEYLEDIREIERRLQNVTKSADPSPDAKVPFGVPESFDEHIKLMWDLQVLAFKADITRVSTLMYAHDVSMRSYPESGVATANHAASHHGGVPKRAEDWAKINRFHVQCLPYFLEKLSGAKLLDDTLFAMPTTLGNSNLHRHWKVGHMRNGAGHICGNHIKAELNT